MQTFMAYPEVDLAAKVLDSKRLRNQTNEGKVILVTSTGLSTSWNNHPAVKMWRGYASGLISYILACIAECEHRDLDVHIVKDFITTKFAETMAEEVVMPPWVGLHAFHASHRSNLLRKDPVWYGVFGWKEPNDYPYYWPV